MKEDFVKLETAKLAKEKGFAEPTLFYYIKNIRSNIPDFIRVEFVDGQFGKITEKINHNNSDHEIPRISAPTQTLLQKWLRINYGAKVWCSPNYNEIEQKEGWDYNIVLKNGNTTHSIISQGEPGLEYEEALELGLNRALNLI